MSHKSVRANSSYKNRNSAVFWEFWVSCWKNWNTRTHIRLAPLLVNFSKVSSRHDCPLKTDIELFLRIFLDIDVELSFENLNLWADACWIQLANAHPIRSTSGKFLKSQLATWFTTENRYRAVFWEFHLWADASWIQLATWCTIKSRYRTVFWEFLKI